MHHWWTAREGTPFSEDDKQRIEDLTGCIPLLLKPFLRHPGGSLMSLEPDVWEDGELKAIWENVYTAALAQKGSQA